MKTDLINYLWYTMIRPCGKVNVRHCSSFTSLQILKDTIICISKVTYTVIKVVLQSITQILFNVFYYQLTVYRRGTQKKCKDPQIDFTKGCDINIFSSLVAPFLTRLHRINPLNTQSDQHLVSPYNNTAELFI